MKTTFSLVISALACILGGNSAWATVLLPDLAPLSVAAVTNQVAFYPPRPQAPSVAVTCVVTNKGLGAAVGYWLDVISISTNATASGTISSQEFGQWQFQSSPGILGGGTYEEVDSVSLPEQSGTYWLIFQANVNTFNGIAETDTTNNTMVAALPVTLSYQVVPPDLAPLTVMAVTNQVAFYPPSPQAPSVAVICVVTNEGLGAAVGNWVDLISIATNATTSGIISSQPFWNYYYSWPPGIPVGGVYAETNIVSLPEQSGTYWLVFQANGYDYLYETDTNNNTLVASVPVTLSYQVVPPDLAPLAVAAVSNQVAFHPPSPQAPSVAVACVVTNEGLGAAVGYWADVISISTNGTTSGIVSSQWFGNYYWGMPGIPAGGIYNDTDIVSLPEQSGTYWLIFQANGYDYLYEADTDNNTLVASVPVTLSYQVVPPDLAPLAVAAVTNQVAFYPPSPQAPSVAVACVVTNEGLGAAVGNWVDVISISTNATTSGIISSRTFWNYYSWPPGIPAGGVYAETNFVSLPEQSGTYWLIFQANGYDYLYETDTNNNTMVASVPVTLSYQVVPPDLAPLSVAAVTNQVAFHPPSPQAPSVDVTCVVSNQGPGAALGEWYDQISISTNASPGGIIAAQQFWQWQFQYSPGILGGGAYEEVSSVSLPEQSGTYWLIFQANANGGLYETDTTNNTMIASAPVTVTYQVVPPDLAPLSVRATNKVIFNPPSPQAPTVQVTCVVKNQGLGPARGQWYDRISVSTDAATDGIVASQQFSPFQFSPGVLPGGVYAETNTVTLPQQSGNYWLVFQANADYSLYETNTGNNTLIAPVPVQVSYQVVPPDLAPVSATVATNQVAFYPPSPQPPTVSMTCVVTNRGRGTALGDWDDVVWISTNATSSGIIGSQDFWQDQESPGVRFGQTYAETNTVALPEQSGTYWLIFQANADGYLYEPDATNNTLTASMPVTVTYQLVPPDLAPVNVTPATNTLVWYPPSPQNPSLAVVCTITNEGLGAGLGNWSDAVYVSTNGTMNGIVSSTFFYQYWSLPGLLPGGTYLETNLVTLPEQSGTYWLIFQANVYGYLAEADGNNNTMVGSIPVTVTYEVVPPDLAPVSIGSQSNNVAFNPPSPQSASVPVVCLVTNEGLGAAMGSWVDTISVSTNGTIGGIISSQQNSQYQPSPGLPSGGTYAETNYVSLPEQSGAYWLIFQANAYGNLDEAATTNNTIIASVPVTLSYQVIPPDLAPVSVLVASNHVTFHPASPQAPTVAVTCTVTNEGFGAALGDWNDVVFISTNSSQSGIISSQEFGQHQPSPGTPAGGTYGQTDSVALPQQSGTYWLIFQANVSGYLYEPDDSNNTMFASAPVTVSYQVIPPDLAPVSAAAASNHVVFNPASPQPPTIPLTCVVTNLGLGAAEGYWSDAISISTDGTTNGIISSQEFWNFYWDAPGVPPGGTYWATNLVSLPEQSGTYWLVFQVNTGGGLYEADATNNTFIDPTPVTVSYQVVPPDLAPLSVAVASNHLVFSPPSPQAPTVPVTCLVKNHGPGPASGSWRDVISISTNRTVGGIISSQEFWQYQDAPGVPSGGTYQETNYVSLPEQSGTYWLILQVNGDHDLYETNLADNAMIGSTSVKVTYEVIPPDLVPLSIAAVSSPVLFAASSPQSLPTVPVVCAVGNQGLGVASGYWFDTILVSTNGTTNGVVGAQDVYLDWSSAPLPPNGIYQETNYVTLPGQSGSYWLILQVNRYNYLFEPSSANNTMIDPTPVTVVTQLTPPDLAPVNIWALTNHLAFYPPSPQASPTMSVAYLITNRGPGTALGQWVDTVWVSTNGSVDGIVASQDFYEDWEPAGLSPGETYQRTNVVTLPAQSGTYWFIVQANDYNYLYEADASNDLLTSSVPVSVTMYPVTPPDLAPVSVVPVTNQLVYSPPETFPWAPPAIQVVYTVTNQGLGLAVGVWYDTVWVSTNGTEDGIVTSQNFGETRDFPGLPPGGVYQRTNAVELPAQNGTYWFIVQANNYNVLYETDTNNNTMTSSVPVSLTLYPERAPDLVPVQLAAASNQVVFHSPSPQFLPSIPVVYTITNEGGVASQDWFDLVSVSTNATTNGIISSQYFEEHFDLGRVLPADGSYVRTNSVTLPAHTGRYWLILQSNAGNWLNVDVSSNRTLIASVPVTLTYSIQPPDLAPLSVSPLTTNLSFHPLQPESTVVAVRCVVTNRGTGLASGPWYDGIYVSTNRTINGAVSSQQFAVQPADPGLSPGGVYQATNFVWLPQRSGNYWLIFQVNDYAQLFELNTSNNLLIAPKPVTLTYSLMTPPGAVTGMLLTSNYAVGGAGSTMTWTWPPTSDAGGYQVTLDQVINGAWQALTTNQTAASSYTFTGITPGARCQVLVSATNAAGAGPLSTNGAFAALPALSGLSVQALTSSSVVFQIVPGLATNYSVGGYYSSLGASNAFGTGPGPSSIAIEGLRPGTAYTFHFYQRDCVSQLTGPTTTTNLTTLTSPASWTPAQLGANVSLWLDAANAGTLTLRGGHVKQWTDLSGGGNDVTNSIAATQPVYQTNGINHRPAVGFTTVGMGLFGAGNFGVSGSAPRTLAAVLDCGLVGTGTPVTNEGFGLDISLANARVPYFDDSGDVVQSHPPFATNASLCVGEYASGVGQGYVNGDLWESTGVAPMTVPGPIQLGKLSDGYSRTGAISEIVYLNAELSAPQRHQLEGYLAWKWGLQGNLPTNHPYRGAAPLVTFASLKAGYLPAQGVQLQGGGVPAYQYIVLSATNLTASATWVPIATNTAAADGTWLFTDTNHIAQPARFYRAMVNLP